MTRKQDAEVATARRFGYTLSAWKKARAKFNARMRRIFTPEFRERIKEEIAPAMRDRAERAAYAHRLLTGIEPKDAGTFSKFAESVYGYLRLRGMMPDEIDRLTPEEMTRLVEEDARKRIKMTSLDQSRAESPPLVIHENGTVVFDGTTYRFKSGRFHEVLTEIARGGGGYVTSEQIRERTKKAGRPIGDPYSAIERGAKEHPRLVDAIIERSPKGYAVKVEVHVEADRRRTDETPTPRR
ncbi:MAG: hypothetical protein AB7G11_13965 [Phycisphaerales bacterium]